MKCRGEAAADDELGAQRGREHGERPADRVARAGEHRGRGGVARARGVDGGLRGGEARVADDRLRPRIGLEAADRAAAAPVAVVARGQVAELAGLAERPGDEAAVDDEAAADAGAEGEPDHVPAAARRAEQPLGPGERAGVVAERDGDTELALERRSDLEPVHQSPGRLGASSVFAAVDHGRQRDAGGRRALLADERRDAASTAAASVAGVARLPSRTTASPSSTTHLIEEPPTSIPIRGRQLVRADRRPRALGAAGRRRR